MIDLMFEAPEQMASRDVVAMTTAVRTLGSPESESVELIEQIARLEELKGAVAAAQVRATAVFAARQRAERQATGATAADAGKGIGAQIALARRESPYWGARHLGLAEALVHELPHTLAALEAGEITEWRATLIVRETACLTIESRRQVDAELANRPGGLGALGDCEVVKEAKRISYRLDPHAVTKRASKAANDRHVTLRPAPDTMTWLGALLPAREGVAAYAALSKAADTARATGDERSRGQLMADTLVERLTGQAAADAVPVEVHLVMTDQTLLAGDSEPADLDGVGPIPAPMARNWLRGDDTDPDNEAKVWLRRLFTSPSSGQLVAMESRRRCFDGQLRRFIITADRTCRTPWCDAPIRHIDHPMRAGDGGPTSADNAQGLCEACNYARESVGWRTIRHPNRAIDTVTPTGHTYRSHPPPPLGGAPPADPEPVAERRRPNLLATA